MSNQKVSAVLFALDHARVAAFYVGVFHATATHADAAHTMLDCAGFELMVQQIPAHIAKTITPSNPVERRERGSLRLDYPVRDIAEARRNATRLGGVIDDQPPPWASDGSYFLGHDPEGNVFCAMLGNA